MNRICLAILSNLVFSYSSLTADEISSSKPYFGGDTISEEETIEDDLFTAGGNVIVRSPVNGDLFAAGGSVEIANPVEGDLFAAGGSVNVTGTVSEDARITGGEIQIGGTIGRNASVFGGSVVVEGEGRIGRDLNVGCGELKIAGTIERDLKGSADHVVLSGRIQRNVEFEAEEITLMPSAQILGNFNYTSPKEADIQEGALIQGETIHHLPEAGIKEEKKGGMGLFSILFKFISLGGLILFGILLILLSPKQASRVSIQIRKTPWKSLGLGLLLLVVVPAAVGALALTLIGIPLALFVLVTFLILLYISKLYAGLLMGQFILKGVGREEKGRLIGSLILGLVILAILTSIPYIGKVFWILTLLLGLGAIFIERVQLYREAKEKGLV